MAGKAGRCAAARTWRSSCSRRATPSRRSGVRRWRIFQAAAHGPSLRREEAEEIQAQARADRAAASESAQRVLARRIAQGRGGLEGVRSGDPAPDRGLERAFQAGRRGRDAQAQLRECSSRAIARKAGISSRSTRRSVARTDASGAVRLQGDRAGVDTSWPAVSGSLATTCTGSIPVDLRPRVKHVINLTEGNAGWPFS